MNSADRPVPVHTKRYAVYTRSAGNDYGNKLQYEAARASLESCRNQGTEPQLAHFYDTGDLGLDLDRLGLNGLCAAAERGDIDVLLVTDYSRLARTTGDMLDLIHVLGMGGVEILALDQTSGRCGPTNTLHSVLLTAMFRYEDELITAARMRDISQPCPICRAPELQCLQGCCRAE